VTRVVSFLTGTSSGLVTAVVDVGAPGAEVGCRALPGNVSTAQGQLGGVDPAHVVVVRVIHGRLEIAGRSGVGQRVRSFC